MDPLVEDPVMGDDVGGIAGHVNYPEIGVDGKDLLRQLPAVHLRQDHIGEQQGDPAIVAPDDLDPLPGGRRHQHREAQPLQHRRTDLQGSGIVLDQQGGLAPAGPMVAGPASVSWSASTPTRGRKMLKVVPAPGALSTSMQPWFCWTMP